MNLRRIASSIATRIILIGVFVVVVGTIARYLTLGHFLREDVGKVVAAQQLALTNFVARDVEHKIMERRELLDNLIAAVPGDLRANSQALRQWLLERHKIQPLFTHGIALVDREGHVLVDTHAAPAGPLNEPETFPLWPEVDNTSWSVGSPRTDTASGQPILPMAVRWPAAKTQPDAFLVGKTALTAPDFLDFTQLTAIGQTGGLLLISPRDKLFLAASKPAMVLRPTPPTGVNALHDRAMAGYRGTGITVNAEGVEEISAMVSVPSTGWFVVGRIPTAEALATVGRAQRFVAGNSLLVVITFVVVSVLALNHVFRPLREAANQADRMTRGEAPMESLRVVRDDEVGELTQAFNRLLSKLRLSQDQMAHMAHHDTLTGLPNRALYVDRLAQNLAMAHRHGHHVGLLYIDLDKFKPINDQYGHEVGDSVLVRIARRLGDALRESDTLARIGGDEFVIILGALDKDRDTALASAITVAQKCIEQLAPESDLGNELHGVGLSIGIAVDNALQTATQLQSAADTAMYLAKQQGGSAYRVAPASSASAAIASA